jgi:hypothetical protein
MTTFRLRHYRSRYRIAARRAKSRRSNLVNIATMSALAKKLSSPLAASGFQDIVCGFCGRFICLGLGDLTDLWILCRECRSQAKNT